MAITINNFSPEFIFAMLLLLLYVNNIVFLLFCQLFSQKAAKGAGPPPLYYPLNTINLSRKYIECVEEAKQTQPNGLQARHTVTRRTLITSKFGDITYRVPFIAFLCLKFMPKGNGITALTLMPSRASVRLLLFCEKDTQYTFKQFCPVLPYYAKKLWAYVPNTFNNTR
jgi:hypothetical protein